MGEVVVLVFEAVITQVVDGNKLVLPTGFIEGCRGGVAPYMLVLKDPKVSQLRLIPVTSPKAYRVKVFIPEEDVVENANRMARVIQENKSALLHTPGLIPVGDKKQVLWEGYFNPSDIDRVVGLLRRELSPGVEILEEEITLVQP